MKPRKKIGEILVESGVITTQQLDSAHLIQQGKNKRLGKVLIELGFLTEAQLVEAISRQLSLPVGNCENLSVSDELKSLIPRETAEKKLVLPLEKNSKGLLLAMADPADWQTIDEMAFRTGLKVSPVIASESSLLKAIEKTYSSGEKVWDLIRNLRIHEPAVEFVKEQEEKEINAAILQQNSEAQPVVQLVTLIIIDAVKSRATDIHIEPGEKNVKVRYRVDGGLRDALEFPKRLQNSVTSRIKIISNLDITNRRLPQDGSCHMKLENREVDLRVSTLPSINGEKIVIRLLDRSAGLIPLAKLGISDRILSSLIATFSEPQGMLLVTGPTGSGKSTTLYALLSQLRSEAENVVTVEDPVEYRLAGITQVAINESIGLKFSTALRSILRQDPDIIMVGEIRDGETAEIAIKSAMTGHFVLSTLHTNDTVSTITRLVDLGVPSFLVGSALTGVIAQRLVRKICDNCKTEADSPDNLAGKVLSRLDHFYTGAGCEKCAYTGYFGQVGIYEYLTIGTKMRRLLARGATEEDLLELARQSGMKNMFEDACEKVNDGTTTIDEVLLKIPFRDHN